MSSENSAASILHLTEDADAVKIRAKEFVEASLKSPSTAIWPSYNEFKVARAEDENGKIIPDVWKVMGYVDSQNSYGAVLRTEWMVTVRKTSPEWTLEKLTTL